MIRDGWGGRTKSAGPGGATVPSGDRPAEPGHSESWALGLVFFALPLAQTFVVRGVSVADIALAVAGGLVLGALARERSWPTLPSWFWIGCLVIAWSVAGAAYLGRWSVLPFSPSELAKSLAKLAFYVAGGLLVGLAARRVGPARWTDLLMAAVATHALIGLYIYLAMQVPWGLPYDFFWTGSQGEATKAYGWRAGVAFVRLRGMAAEPSYCGVFLTLGLSAALLARPATRRFGWREPVAALAILLTLSLGSYALAAIALPLVLASRPAEARRVLRLLGAAAVAVGLLLVAAPTVRTAFRLAIVARTVGIVDGTASPKETVRVTGSWSAALSMARASPVFGAGLGNFDVAIEAVSSELDPRLGMYPGAPGWCVPAYLLGALGWGGLVLYGLLAGEGLRRNWAGGLVWMAGGFADGTFLGAPSWVFYVLLTLPRPVHAAGLARTARLSRRAATSATGATSPAVASGRHLLDSP